MRRSRGLTACLLANVDLGQRACSPRTHLQTPFSVPSLSPLPRDFPVAASLSFLSLLSPEIVRAPTSIKLTHLSSSSQFASNMKTFCIAAILATASAAKSAMRGTPEIVDLAAASKGTRTSGVHEASNGKNQGDFDATVKQVKIWTKADPVGVTIDGGDGSSDKHYMVKETCMKGFSGLNCQINDNDCIDVETGAPLCLHKSTCTDGIASFNCDCTDTGHEDATCSSPSKCIRGGGVIPGTYGCSELHGTITGVSLFDVPSSTVFHTALWG